MVNLVNWIMEYKKKLNESKFRRRASELIRTEEKERERKQKKCNNGIIERLKENG